MIAWISPAFSSRLIPLRIALPSTVAWRFSIFSIIFLRQIYGHARRGERHLPGDQPVEEARIGDEVFVQAVEDRPHLRSTGSAIGTETVDRPAHLVRPDLVALGQAIAHRLFTA